MEQFNHRFLDRHVQGAGGFIADDNLRFQHQGPGDGDTLPLAAGHVIGIPVRKFFRQVHGTQHFFRLIFHVILIDESIIQKGLTDDFLHPLLRVEGSGGILEDHLDMFPSLPEFFSL